MAEEQDTVSVIITAKSIATDTKLLHKLTGVRPPEKNEFTAESISIQVKSKWILSNLCDIETKDGQIVSASWKENKLDAVRALFDKKHKSLPQNFVPVSSPKRDKLCTKDMNVAKAQLFVRCSLWTHGCQTTYVFAVVLVLFVVFALHVKGVH